MFINGSKLNEQSLQRTNQDISYQVSAHFAKRFQRRFFFKSTNQDQEFPVADMFFNGSALNEPSLQRIFKACFLPNFYSFGKAVSEEKNF